ncbi:hypothetical protein HI914_05646 [Erysiphe necator]|nr:hypothetical protein HI914_05646 [Erysiphe necator]
MTEIQNFVLREEKGVFAAWALIKEYRRKAISANSQLKLAYADAALFHFLAIQPNLSVEEKVDMLTEHEMEMRLEEKMSERGYAAKPKVKISNHHNKSLGSDSESEKKKKQFQPDKKPISFTRGNKFKRNHGYKAVSSSSEED